MVIEDRLLGIAEKEGLDNFTLRELGTKCGVTAECIRQTLKRLEISKRAVRDRQRKVHPLCACGCGHRVRWPRSRFLVGHAKLRYEGRKVDVNGYILVLRRNHHLANCNGYVMEQRLIAEEAIGRELTVQEVVHHLDGNVANNYPDNLAVFPSAGVHAAFHKRLREAEEIRA